MERARVAPDPTRVHTPTMTLKTAALVALVGTILMTVLLVWNFVFTLLNVLRDLVPAVTLFQSFIDAFGWLPKLSPSQLTTRHGAGVTLRARTTTSCPRAWKCRERMLPTCPLPPGRTIRKRVVMATLGRTISHTSFANGYDAAKSGSRP